MKEILFVGVGSCVGGIGRYLLTSFASSLFVAWQFPIGTLLVNIGGCFIIGILAGGIELRQGGTSPDLKLFLMTGVLGGFTTFSAFGYETITLLRNGALTLAVMNIGLSIALGLIAVGAGMWISLRL